MGGTKVISECVNHTYAGDKDGYGRTDMDKVPVFLHRYVYAVANGLRYEDLKGKIIRHTCDNSRCINPAHLIEGTVQDNVADRVARGRSTKVFGVAHSNSKLTREQVLDIRFMYARGHASQQELADKYAMSVQSISNVTTRRTYKDVV